MKESINRVLDFLYDNLGIVLYAAAWLFLVGYFWINVSGTEAFGYSLIAFYLVLPVCSFAVTLYYGLGERKIKYYLPVICGVLEMMSGFCTFNFANMLSNGKWNTWNLPDLQMSLYSLVPALVGLGIGSLIRHLRKKKAVKK